MRETVWRLGLGFLAAVTLVAGCTPAAGENPAAVGDVQVGENPSQQPSDGVFAEGVVEPVRVVTLRAAVGGRLIEVAAAEGEDVVAETVLAQVDPTDAELAVQRARAALAQAEAQLASARSGAREEQLAALAAQVQAADATVAQAAAQRDVTTAGLVQADELTAQADLLQAEIAHESADEAHDDTMKCYEVPSPEGGTREICPTLGTLEEIARAQMEAAYAGILAAKAQLERVQAGAAPDAAAAKAAVSAAVARRQAAEAQLLLAQAGARDEEIKVAESGVAQAEAAVEQAAQALTMTKIEVPFDGVLTDLPVAEGDTVAVGESIGTIATLDALQVRTTDLTELDVAELAVGDEVAVTLDAVPDQVLPGTISRIGLQGASSFGDVFYDVIIDLDAVPDWVRWGMTAQVETTGGVVATANETVASGSFIAEGAATPERSAGLQFTAGGEVVEIYVAAGNMVAAGDVIARLDDGSQRLAVAAAQAGLATAQAELALMRSGPRPEEVAAAEADVAAAKAGLWQATATRDEVTAGVAEAQVAGVEAQLAQARAQKRQLEAALLWAEGDEDDERADKVREQIRAVEVAMAGHEARLDALPVVSSARLRGGNAGIGVAAANVAVAQAALDLLLAGPTEASVQKAEAAVQQAQVDLAEAEAALERTRLIAPFAGTVTRLDVEVGDTVAPGRPVVVLADLASLRVETTDLTERDVVSVRIGEAVTLTVDALPGETYQGHVSRIKRQSVALGDDVTYPVIIELDQEIPGLRWGMTVAVELGGGFVP